MSQQYKTITQTDANGDDFSCVEVQHTTKGPVRFENWALCAICGLEFPRSEMTEDNGKFYCQKFRHNEEIGERR